MAPLPDKMVYEPRVKTGVCALYKVENPSASPQRAKARFPSRYTIYYSTCLYSKCTKFCFRNLGNSWIIGQVLKYYKNQLNNLIEPIHFDSIIECSFKTLKIPWTRSHNIFLFLRNICVGMVQVIKYYENQLNNLMEPIYTYSIIQSSRDAIIWK